MKFDHYLTPYVIDYITVLYVIFVCERHCSWRGSKCCRGHMGWRRGKDNEWFLQVLRTVLRPFLFSLSSIRGLCYCLCYLRGFSRRQPWTMKTRHLLKKTQDRRNTVHRTMTPQSPSEQAPGDLTHHHQLPHRIFLNLINVWNVFSLKGDFSFGKTQKSQGDKSGLWGAESPGRLDVSPKNSAQDMMHERACCCDEAAHHQLPIATGFWIIWIVSMEESSSLTQNWMQICCSTHAVILNVTATQYTCSLNSIYRPHWLVQWSHHCSHMRIPVHSPWLPGYIHVAQNVLIIVTMAGLFPDRPHILKEIKMLSRTRIEKEI